MYNKDEYKQLLNSIQENVGDHGKITELIVELNKHNDEVLSAYDEAVANAGTLKERNDSLIEANGNLLQYVGVTKAGTLTTQTAPDADPEPEDPMPVEDLVAQLIAEKGEF